MKWIVSVQFTRSKAYHQFFSLLNRGRINNTKRTAFNHGLQIIEFETTTEPDLEKLNKLGLAVQPKIVGIISDKLKTNE
jgi:hypothetical protein